MKLNMRLHNSKEDYWRIREFLRQVMLANKQHEFSWHVARWDYWIWFGNPDIERIILEENVFIWETEAGQIAAVLNPEQCGQIFIQIHPEYKTAALEEAMIAVAEERMYKTFKEGYRKVFVWSDSKDDLRAQILARRGFKKVEGDEVREIIHYRSLDDPIPDSPVPQGYIIRSQGSGLELLERCYASGLGFHNDDINVARVNRDDPAWYFHIQTAPLYRRDLDIIAIAENGSIASFCTIWFDDVTRTAYIEPVATVPAHQKRGLGKAVIREGLRRLKRMGCNAANVGGYSEAANALYFSVMGREHDIHEPWEKMF